MYLVQIKAISISIVRFDSKPSLLLEQFKMLSTEFLTFSAFILNLEYVFT